MEFLEFAHTCEFNNLIYLYIIGVLKVAPGK